MLDLRLWLGQAYPSVDARPSVGTARRFWPVAEALPGAPVDDVGRLARLLAVDDRHPQALEDMPRTVERGLAYDRQEPMADWWADWRRLAARAARVAPGGDLLSAGDAAPRHLEPLAAPPSSDADLLALAGSWCWARPARPTNGKPERARLTAGAGVAPAGAGANDSPGSDAAARR